MGTKEQEGFRPTTKDTDAERFGFSYVYEGFLTPSWLSARQRLRAL